jgi:hypothetical protein
MKTTLPILFWLLFFASFANAQTFTNLNSGFPTMTNASVAWADYDNDGDLDFAFCGFSGLTAEVTLICRNDGNGNFTYVDSDLAAVSSGSVNWGDFDNDGDPDLLVNGQNGGLGDVAITKLYRNDGNDAFTLINTTLAPVIGTARWIDYDGDGWLDVITAGLGITLINDSLRLYHNNGNSTFTVVPTNLPGYAASDIAVADFDNDGDQDFFITGGTLSVSTFPVSALYRNDGNGNFSEDPIPLANLSTGTGKWGDYDNDGDLDLLYDGIDSTFSMGITVLYRNDGSGNFTLINANLPGTGEPGSVDWGDVDNDGDLDILLGGSTYLLRNDGNDVFTDITPPDFVYAVPNSFADIDGDDDLDILSMQMFGGNYASTIWRNDLIGTSVNNLISGDSQYALFPNPCRDFVSLQFSKLSSDPISFTLFNVLGENVYSQPLAQHHSSVVTLTLPVLESGMYFYEIEEEKNVIGTGKLTVN